MENVLHVVGGGNTIGTNCYYLQVDGHRFLLDCGASLRQRPYVPNLAELNPYIDGLWQLDAVVLSHAHGDHVGALPYVASIGTNVPVLCNPVTATLTGLQLRQLDGLADTFRSQRQREQYQLQKEQVLNQLTPIGFMKPYRGQGYTITLFPAGHIPGAAMVYIETDQHRILYTGDFSCQPELLCGAYHLPEDLPVDVLICEGTHQYKGTPYGIMPQYENLAFMTAKELAYGPVVMTTTNVTKGIELARYLARVLPVQYDVHRPIYIDQPLLPIASAFEAANYQVFSAEIQPAPSQGIAYGEACVLLTRPGYGPPWGMTLNGDAFTLHASRDDIQSLICRLQAPTTLLVHAQPPQSSTSLVPIPGYTGSCLQTGDGLAYRFV